MSGDSTTSLALELPPSSIETMMQTSPALELPSSSIATMMQTSPVVPPLVPIYESPQIVAVRNAVNQLLLELSIEEDSYAYLRDICQETLALKLHTIATLSNSSISSESSAISPTNKGIDLSPRSPQERIRAALVPTVMDKSKTRYRRGGSSRNTTTMMNIPANVPRWRIPQADELPIVDLAVIFTGDTVPDGFTKIERSPSGQRADLNKGGGGVFVYLCARREVPTRKLPISEILVIYPDRGEFVPTDYEVVQRRGVPANVNTGTQGEKIHLCMKRSINSSIVDVSVLFPRKGDQVPYGYMKVDKSPDGHTADLNASTGGTEVLLSYKKIFHCMTDLHTHWLNMPPNPVHDKPSFSLESTVKSDELRTISPPPAPIKEIDKSHEDYGPLAEFYMFPLLLACYTRHGNAAEIALRGIAQCIDAGLFDDCLLHSPLCRIDVVVEAISSICHQGVKSRFAMILPFFRKMIRRSVNGFNPAVLHATLKSLIFIGDFDTSLVKSIEDELMVKIMSRYEAEQTACPRTSTIRSSFEIVDSIVHDIVDDVSDSIEVVNMTEILLGIFKTHHSIHSYNFCTDIMSAIDQFLSTSAEKNAYQLVITLCKSVSRKAHRISTGIHTNDPNLDREYISIINSLRALNVTLLTAGPHTREHRGFGQMVRRFVFTTANVIPTVWSTDVFRSNLTLISTLWTHYRRHLKVEFALIFEHHFLRILRNNSVGAITYQLHIMEGLTPWLQLPHNVVEIFLNFDMDRVQQWKIFEHLCAALCSIAEGNSGHNSTTSTTTEEAEAKQLLLQTNAMTSILAISRSVMDASGHAYLINRDARTRLLSMDHGGWEQDERDGSFMDNTPKIPTSLDNKRPPNVKNTISIRILNELQKKNQQVLKRAIEIASSKSLKKSIEYLVAMNFINETAREITSFLRIYHDFFDETEIGDYLGEGDEDFKDQVRLTYVRAISFKGMTLVESLRHFLTSGGFRLPGEAQKIERMVEAFAQCFYEDSPASFSSSDTAMILAYSIIMLNTDLHNPQVKKNKMSKEQFVKNNRGIDNGKDLPRRILEEVYDDILHHPMHIHGSRFVPKARESVLSIVELDMDKFRGNISRSVAQSEELMKDLSRSNFSFSFVGIDTSMSPDLINLLFERVWFYLLALSTSILCDNQSDLSLTMQCLDLLRYSISTCLFLGMSVERRAFCNLLTKVQTMIDEEQAGPANKYEMDDESTYVNTPSVMTTRCVENIETAAATDDPWRVMGDIHMLITNMKESIQRRQRSEELNSVIKRISRGNYYLKYTTHFIREGDLTKKCRSRNQTYRFFLFNDQLIYADKGISGHWNPHKALRLRVTRISDVPESVLNKHAFQITNPVKSFIVYADNAHNKLEWMRLIEDAITEVTRRINMSARRLSFRNEPSSSSTLGSVAATSPTALAASAMKNLMRRTSKLSSPEKEDACMDSYRSGVTLTQLIREEEMRVAQMTESYSIPSMLDTVAISTQVPTEQDRNGGTEEWEGRELESDLMHHSKNDEGIVRHEISSD